MKTDWKRVADFGICDTCSEYTILIRYFDRKENHDSTLCKKCANKNKNLVAYFEDRVSGAINTEKEI